MGFLDKIFQRGVRLEATPDGPRLTHPSGLTWIAPGEGELVPAFSESPVSPAFDGGVRLRAYPVEVRVRVDAVRAHPGAAPPAPGSPPPPPPPVSNELAHDLCLFHAERRTEGEPLAGVAQGWQLEQWRVAAAASTIYPLAKPEGAFDMEECHVLLVPGERGEPPRAAVFWKLFAKSKVTPALWSELNGRMNETLSWGGAARAPLPRATSFYVDARMELTAEARSAATALAAELARAGVAAPVVAEAAANVQRFAFGSDAPDTPLEAEVKELLPPALLEPIAAPALRSAIERELATRVKTYRDFRGLHAFLEVVASTLDASPGGSKP